MIAEKALKTIQGFAKVAKVLSMIVFVCAIIGFVGCVIAAVVAAAVTGSFFDAIKDMVAKFTKEDIAIGKDAVLVVSIAGAIICAAEAVLSKFAFNYFRREVKDGTPFTSGGAAELRRLGYLALFIPIGAAMIVSIFYGIMQKTLAGIPDWSFSNGGTIVIGALFLVGSYVFEYGAEKLAAQTAVTAAELPNER